MNDEIRRAAAGPPRDDAFAAELRGFGPVGLLAMLGVIAGNFLMPPLSALLALVWVRRSRTPWAEIGFVRPRSWFAVLAGGIVLGVALKLLMKSVVMPLLGAPPINPTYHHLVGNTLFAVPFVFELILEAGFGEEIFFRGYLFERLGKLLGRGVGAKTVTVLATSAFFAALHAFDQGLPGVQQAAVTGLVFGTIYAATDRIWLPIVAHAAFDLAALAIIYWNLETAVAQWFFR